MSQLLEEQQIKVQKQLHKASDVFLHATEKQCSYVLARQNKGETEKEYCAIGLLGLYSGNEPNADYITIDGDKTFGFNILNNEFNDTYSFFGIDQAKSQKCPECEKTFFMSNLLPHLNNEPTHLDLDVNSNAHGWTFKQTGEWLKTIGY